MCETFRKNACRAALLVVLLLLVMLPLPRAVFAHNPMTSWAVARLYEDRMELEVEMAAESAWAFLGEPADVPPDVASKLPQLKARAAQAYRVLDGGTQLAASAAEVELKEEDGVGLLLVYPRPTAGPLRFEAVYLSKLPTGHRTTLTLKDERDVVRRTELLTATNAAVELPLPSDAAGAGDAAQQSAGQTVSFWAFLKLGVEHILTGYDHLLFLLGLLVACRRFKSMALVVTCFTLAHSLTLALAALDLVSLPPRVVEPLIAASIVFVGIENLVRRDEPRWRWALTFGFGLIHGFGFAGVLKEIGLGNSTSALVTSLFSFNLGVEVGQLAVTALLLPLLWKLRELPAYERYGRHVISALVALAGAYWLAQRLFF